MFTIKTTTAALLATGLVCSGAEAAVVTFEGLQTEVLDTVIGAGNTGQLSNDATTHWASTTSVSIVDLNGFTFTLDSGNGNGQTYNGAMTGPGTLAITGRFEVDAGFTDLTLGGSSNNTMTNVVINQGTLNLNKDAGVDALAGPISFVGAVNEGELSWVQSNQINDSSSIDATGGAGAFSLELNDQVEVISGLTLKAGDVVETGNTGVLTVTSLTVDGQSFGAGAYTSSESFITGGGSVVVIPEPGSLALLGLGGLMMVRRRRG